MHDGCLLRDGGVPGARWVAWMLDQPAMGAWQAAALAETFREDAHEAEVAAVGVVTEDRRAAL